MLVTHDNAAVKINTAKFIDGKIDKMKTLAEQKAKETRSYIFPIYRVEKTKGFRKEKSLVGYGVPR